MSRKGHKTVRLCLLSQLHNSDKLVKECMEVLGIWAQEAAVMSHLNTIATLKPVIAFCVSLRAEVRLGEETTSGLGCSMSKLQYTGVQVQPFTHTHEEEEPDGPLTGFADLSLAQGCFIRYKFVVMSLSLVSCLSLSHTALACLVLSSCCSLLLELLVRTACLALANRCRPNKNWPRFSPSVCIEPKWDNY